MSNVKKLKKKYYKKFRKYYKKLSRYEIKARLRKKVLKLVKRIGISKPDEFLLVDPIMRKRLFPCHLGILFLGIYDDNLFYAIKNQLEQAFQSFFYSISNLGILNITEDLLKKGIKKKNSETNSKFKKLDLHPTNKFYQILINKRIENNLDMIVAITDLPLYSSSDQQIEFLYGEAHLKHSCCVVSTLILQEQFYNKHKNENLFETRVVKETLHEVGHLILDSTHCVDDTCLMKFSENIDDIDNKSYSLCEKCNIKLRRIRKDYNF